MPNLYVCISAHMHDLKHFSMLPMPSESMAKLDNETIVIFMNNEHYNEIM